MSLDNRNGNDALRKVTAAAIRVAMLERADHKLLMSTPPGNGAMYSTVRKGVTVMELHQHFWDRLVKAKQQLKAAVETLKP